eukprot:TRINITY_DN1294_c0_g1_i1.p1 TRINITY_DN1294_c0_g1~~TRINITY_DN1294_c0_g1_i1.p1  ORF type:complete len:196 (+),score=39.89 TRINITY_DN1294_c0_g1_i1:138-725(+)
MSFDRSDDFEEENVDLSQLDFDIAEPDFQPLAAVMGPRGAEYIYNDDDTAGGKRMSWQDRGTWLCGVSWFSGAVLGAFIGLFKARQRTNVAGKILVNSVLNSVGRSGARYANGAGVIALFWSSIDYFSWLAREKNDEFNLLSASVLTPVLFYSGKGPMKVAMGAVGGGLFGAALVTGRHLDILRLRQIFPTDADF